jgi:flavin reductase (DIM6/NTAB) family NADH-FMN oxidoreductase RutF
MDSAARKRVLGRLTYGLYVVTVSHDGRLAAASVNFLTQTSFDPPLIVVGMKAGSGIARLSEASGRFAVNILGADQKDTAAAFFKSAKAENGLINGEAYAPGANGSPILASVPCAFECEVEEILKTGDHHIVVGRVTALHEHDDRKPLTMEATDWSYGG